ncbi:hypothetical protein HYW55_06360 [Candidatus Gottesmanbacteria bacterium]|nr:hypothetical protein [Candidatus Gottesmanbacteria bacterium]
MQRLLLIDGHAILHRAFHALPPLTTSKGQQVNAVYGFITMLLRVLEEYKPTHVAVAFDRPKPTFRKKLFDGYQAKRPKMDKELIPQIAVVHTVLETMKIPVFELDGYEADDVLGTLAMQAKRKKMEAIIVTGDRDLLQLVNSHVKVALPVKGISESKLYDEEEVVKKWEIHPFQVADFKALTGDQSDNYPGVAGIGPKTASSLLTQFKTLEGMYKHLEKIGNASLREKLETHKESAELSKKLATIVTDVPVHFNTSESKLHNLNTLDTQLLLDHLEFRSLIPRLSLKKEPVNSKQKTVNSEKIKSEIKDQQIKLF